MVDLPRLILIADRFTEPDVARAAEEAVSAGVAWVHLRDHEASDESFAEAARRLIPVLRAGGARVTINTRLNVAREMSTGLHVGVRGPSVMKARHRLDADTLIGFSAHNVSEITDPDRQHADYFFLSPIFPTDSKPGHTGLGLDVVAEAVNASAVPFYALGGITPGRARRCLEAGAHGVAVLSGILHAKRPSTAARRYLAAVDLSTTDTKHST